MATVDFQFTDAQREQFAGELLRNPLKPMDAAIAVFGTERMGVTAFVAAEWPNDPKILEITNKLLGTKEGASAFMPTKEAAAIRIWQWTNEGPKDERIKAMKLLAEVSGWIEKPDTSGAEVHEMPPSVTYAVGADHDKAPA